MSRAATVLAMIARIRNLSDTESQTLRHTDNNIVAEINAAWQLLREKVSEAGGGVFLTWDTSITLTVGPFSTNARFQVFNAPTGCVRPYLIQVVVSADDIRNLDPISPEQTTEYWSVRGSQLGIPTGFFVLNVDPSTGTNGPQIAVSPAPDKAYPILIAYVKEPAALTSGSTINCMVGWEEWVVQTVVLHLAERDNDMQNCAAVAAAERDRVWTEVIAPASQAQRVAPLRRFDARSMRRMTRNWGRP
jgi:hypothetical protein